MGLRLSWQEDFFTALAQIDPTANFISFQGYCIINCGRNIFVHLVPLFNNYEPQALILIQETYAREHKLLVHLWEDVWLNKGLQVMSRIKSFLGLNKRVHGRKTKIELLSKKEILDFLNENHLQGYVRAKYNYGLSLNGELIAAAGFSAPRPMKSKGLNYRSAELVRFASAHGLTVVGGLSKLIGQFVEQVKINDLMTYADRDWSLGKGYDRLGFEFSGYTTAQFLYVDELTLTRYFPHRLPKDILLDYKPENILNLDDFLLTKGYKKIFNTGNIRYHFYLT